MENLRQLHIIRGIAALYVAVAHSKIVLWPGGKAYLDAFPRASWHIADYFLFGLDMLSSAAQEFVIVFFILSGFFIAYSFRKNKWSLKDFYINRIVRIYPPYLFSVIAGIAVFLFIAQYNPYLFSGNLPSAINMEMLNSHNELNGKTILRSLVFLPNTDYVACNFAYWSLFPEWIFYLIIPFLINRKNSALLALFLLYLINIIWLNNSNNNLLLHFLFRYGFYFFLGASFFSLIDHDRWKRWLPGHFVSYIITLILFFSTIGLGALNMEPYSNLCAAAFTLCAVAVLLAYPLRNKAVFRTGVFLGDISYSLYIIHLPVLYLLYAIISKVSNTYVFYSRIYWMAVPVLIGVAYLSYVLIEQKTLILITKLKADKNELR